MGDLTYPSVIAPYTFREGYDYKKYLEDQSHFDNLATDIDQSIAKLALSNAEVARLSTEAIVESQREAASQINQGLDSIRVGIERLDDSIVDLRQSVEDVRWAIDEVRYSIESGFQLTAQRLSVIEGVLRDLLEAVKSPEKTWALEKYDIAKDLYRRELYEDALSYLNDALHGHGDRRGYIFDPRVHMLKGNILLGDAENFEPNLIDLAAAKKCFDEAVKYAKPPRDMLSGADEARQEALFQPRVFARCSSAWASYVRGDIAEAEKEYREAVKEGPNDARAHYYLGKSLAHQGKFDEAERALAKAIRENFLYIAKLAADQDYLKDRKRFERTVATYRIELLDRLKPFAEVLCLLRANNSSMTYSDFLNNDLSSWRYRAIQAIDLDLAANILDRTAEIGPMVSNYEKIKRGAFEATNLIEFAAGTAIDRSSQAQSRKSQIRKPSHSGIAISHSETDRIVRKHRVLGWSVAAIVFIFGGAADAVGGSTTSASVNTLISLILIAVAYAIFGAPIIGAISQREQVRGEQFKQDSEYRAKVSEADLEIAAAVQRSREAEQILAQLRRISPKLTEAPR